MGVSSFSPASAVKGVNQRVTWFTPFFAPKNPGLRNFLATYLLNRLLARHRKEILRNHSIWLSVDWASITVL